MTYKQYYDSLLNMLNEKETTLSDIYNSMKDEKGYINYEKYLQYIDLKKAITALQDKCTDVNTSISEGRNKAEAKVPATIEKSLQQTT